MPGKLVSGGINGQYIKTHVVFRRDRQGGTGAKARDEGGGEKMHVVAFFDRFNLVGSSRPSTDWPEKTTVPTSGMNEKTAAAATFERRTSCLEESEATVDSEVTELALELVLKPPAGTSAGALVGPSSTHGAVPSTAAST